MSRKILAVALIVAAITATTAFDPHDPDGQACNPNGPTCEPRNTQVLETGLVRS